MQWSTFGYDGTEYRGDDAEPITPNERFYSVTKTLSIRTRTRRVWRLEIGGLVDRPRAYTYATFARCQPPRRKQRSCASATISAEGS